MCSFSQILKKNILSINKRFVNIHDSLLPDYKGPSPTFWVLYNNESYTGYTVHYINEKIDSGETIYQKMINIDYGKIDDEEDLVSEIFNQVSKDICRILLSIKNIIKFDSILSNDRYYSFPNKKQRLKLMKKLKDIK